MSDKHRMIGHSTWEIRLILDCRSFTCRDVFGNMIMTSMHYYLWALNRHTSTLPPNSRQSVTGTIVRPALNCIETTPGQNKVQLTRSQALRGWNLTLPMGWSFCGNSRRFETTRNRYTVCVYVLVIIGNPGIFETILMRHFWKCLKVWGISLNLRHFTEMTENWRCLFLYLPDSQWNWEIHRLTKTQSSV